MSDRNYKILDLRVGDIIEFPIDEQAGDRRLIVDERTPEREGTVPLLGEGGGTYHVEEQGNLLYLNFFSMKRSKWIGQARAPPERIIVDRVGEQ